MDKTVSDPGPHPAKKVLLFKAIAILLPFLIFLLLEIALRIIQYGDDLGLFVEYSGDRNFLMLNPKASRKYFADQALATTGNRELFRKNKAVNAFRIFVLGESTTLGYPYFHNGSFHRWLQYRLMHTFPDHDFEVVNLSLTAVNSYTVLGFARDVVAYSPDAVLIYSGHNEYYGALGVASTDTLGGNPWILNSVLALRNLRLFQLITNLYEQIVHTPPGQSGDTRMKLMVAETQISLGSALYERGRIQFQSNLQETLDLLSRHNVPVFISTLVSNEKDIKPFVSCPEEGLLTPEFKTKYHLGEDAWKKKDIALAFRYFSEANVLYNGHALCNYYLGRAAFEMGDFSVAKEYFSRAKDLDGLRFRATEEVNQIIIRLSKNYPNTRLVDTKKEFEDASPHQIIGDELLLEHVHPNLKGYALLSNAFYKRIRPLFTFSPKTREMTFEQLQLNMPITHVDALAGAIKVQRLKTSWPFNERGNPDNLAGETLEGKLAWQFEQKHIEWATVMDSLYRHYIRQGELSKARKAIEGLVLEYPADPGLCEKAAMINGKLGDEEKALLYFRKAFYLSPSVDGAKYICSIYLQRDEPDNAMTFLDYAIENKVSVAYFLSVRTATREIMHLKHELKQDSVNLPILNRISSVYLKMGNLRGATKYIQKALTLNDDDRDARLMFAQIKNIQKRN